MRRGVLLLLVLALLASGCAVLGNGSYTVTAELTRSYNLFPGSPVRVAGIDVGTISDISVPEGAETVQVTMAIDDTIALPADATAVVVPESLIGERYVQLPAHEDGEELADGATIPVDRTQVPYEFDEVLENLNSFVGTIDEDEMSRFVDNFAEILDGQGAQLGATLDEAHEAIGVLKDNDQELIQLASRLSDLNATLATRDQQLGRVIEDFDTLATSLVDDRENIDAALTGLVEMTDELARLLETNRETLEQDIATLTRVGRTAQRNLDYLSVGILNSAELFRHAERIIDRERNMLPLQTQLEQLVPQITDAVIFRLQGLCLQAGLDEDQCALDVLEGLVGGEICLPPLLPCGEGGDGDSAPLPLEEALSNLVASDPELGEVVLDELLARQQERREREEQREQAEQEPSDGQDPPEPDGDGDGAATDDDGGLLDGLLGGGGDR